MQTQPTGKFPDPLNRIEFRAVWRHKLKLETSFTLKTPFFVQPGMVIGSVVQNHDYPTARARTPLSQSLEKGKETLSVEAGFFPLIHKLTISQPSRPKIANAFPRRMMKQNRILYFRWHPHPTLQTVLLEMDFVQ